MDDEQTPPAAPAATASGRDRAVRLVEEVASLEARIAELHAAQVTLLSVLQVDDWVEGTGLDLVDELAPRLRWTSFTAARRLVTAARLATCFPVLLEDLAGGELDYHRVDVVVREAELLDEEQALVLDAVLAGRLPGLTTTQIKDIVRREISLIDSDAVIERARRALAQRRAWFTPMPDGRASLELLGPAPALRAVYDRLDALAKDRSRPGAAVDPYADHPAPDAPHAPRGDDGALPRGGDGGSSAFPSTADGGSGTAPGADARSIDAKRFDAAVEMLLAPVRGAEGTATGTGPQITVAWTAATGRDDLPAHLAGYGALPAEAVRHLLRSAGFRCVATDPVSGHAVAVDDHAHPAGSLPQLATASHAVEGTGYERTAVVGAGPGGAPDTPASTPPALDEGLPRATTTRSEVITDRSAALRPAERPRGSRVDGPVIDPHEDFYGPAHDVLGDRDDRRCWADGNEEGPYPETLKGWEDEDPSCQSRDDEFTVTLDISRFRPSTLVNPLRVHDTAAWCDRARRRARSAAAACPTAADPAHPYRFGAALRRLLLRRFPTCAAPGCRAPAHRCDLDHTVDHALGGPTCACNAAPLCRRHHTAKHGAAWQVVRTHDDPRAAGLTWLSPLGYLYSVSPLPLLPLPSPLVEAHVQQRRRAREALARELSARPPLGALSSVDDHPVSSTGADGGTSTGEVDRNGSTGAPTTPPRACTAPDHLWDRDCDDCNPVQPRFDLPVDELDDVERPWHGVRLVLEGPPDRSGEPPF